MRFIKKKYYNFLFCLLSHNLIEWEKKMIRDGRTELVRIKTMCEPTTPKPRKSSTSSPKKPKSIAQEFGCPYRQNIDDKNFGNSLNKIDDIIKKEPKTNKTIVENVTQTTTKLSQIESDTKIIDRDTGKHENRVSAQQNITNKKVTENRPKGIFNAIKNIFKL